MTIFRTPTLIALFSCLMLLVTASAFADLYKYTDSNGAVSITDRLDAVPKKYRSTMKVVKDEKKEAPKGPNAQAMPETPAPEPAAQAAPPPAAASSKGGWVKPVLVIVGVIAGFFVVLKLGRSLASAQLAKVVYLAFFLGVSVFLYKAYAEHLVEGTLGVKAKILSMFKKANVRELPASGDLAREPVK